MNQENRYTVHLLRHESTSCKAEQALILKSLQSERHARLTMAVNLTSEKKHTEANSHYRAYKECSKVLHTITGNSVYTR